MSYIHVEKPDIYRVALDPFEEFLSKKKLAYSSLQRVAQFDTLLTPA